MRKQKKIGGAAVFTVFFCGLLVVLLAWAMVYLSTATDFIKPLSLKIDGDSYDYTLDEYAAYLQEKGLLSTAEGTSAAIKGVAEAKQYGDTLLVRYDINDPAWKTTVNIGNDTLADGTWLLVYGQFGLSGIDPQTANDVTPVLESFPMEFSGNHGNKTVWDYSFEEFVAYMTEKGIFLEEPVLMMTIGTENWIYNGIDVIWWDVENLVDGTEESDNWLAFQEDGYIMIGDYVYFPQFNGPFAICATASCALNPDLVYEVFAAFPGK